MGSVSTNVVIMDNSYGVIEKMYLRTKGRPIEAVQKAFEILRNRYEDNQIVAAGVTGSGRKITSYVVGSDIIKNEITAHATAVLNKDKDVRTIIEIGGQDSKIIILKNGIVTDFAMNTVCAAGTGSFLDRQAERLNIPIADFGDHALKSSLAVRIAGRCAVFAESDMIHKQQLGYGVEDIINGLCEALVRNYLSNVAKGKDIQSKIYFQGGVAANKGIKNAFEKELKHEVYIPEYFNVMGAIGSAILSKEYIEKNKVKTNFKGFNIVDYKFSTNSFECKDCTNRCEIAKIVENSKIIGYMGDRCGKWGNFI